jgi:hypothetical protein
LELLLCASHLQACRSLLRFGEGCLQLRAALITLSGGFSGGGRSSFELRCHFL